MSDFSKRPEDDPEPAIFEMDVEALVEFKAKWQILDHIDLIPTGDNVVQVYRPTYSMRIRSSSAIRFLFLPRQRTSAAIMAFVWPSSPCTSISFSLCLSSTRS